MRIRILSALLIIAHCAIGIKFNSHKFTVSEVSSFSEDTWKEKFEAFIIKYGKKYDTEEEYAKRFNAYKVNKKKISLFTSHSSICSFFTGKFPQGRQVQRQPTIRHIRRE